MEIAQAQDGLITAAQCRSFGIDPNQVKHSVRQGRWAVVNRGIYLVDADRRGEPGMKTLIRAAILSSGPHAVVIGRAAAILHGLEGVDQRTRIDINLPGDRARPTRMGETVVATHQLVLPESQVVRVAGIRVTHVARTVADLLLTAHRYEAMAVLDSALYQGLLTEEELAGLEPLMAGRRGVVRARTFVEQADGRAESPLETRARLRCLDGGVPPDDLQVTIADDLGRAIARVDMLWSRARLIGEADGHAFHGSPQAVYRDRERQNALTVAGFAVVRFTWEDTMTPDRIPAIVRRALAGRRSFPVDL